MQITSSIRNYPTNTIRQADSDGSVPPAATQDSPIDKIELEINGSAVATSALAGAAYGALVGGGSSYLYGSTDLASATALHMTAIIGGGALGAVGLSHFIDHQFEKPTNYVMGALFGAGVTWGTSALGMLGRPAVGIVAGAMAGAFYGAMGGVFFGHQQQ